jgi:inhibitor of KinA
LNGASAYEKPRMLPCGDTAVSVEFGNVVDRSVNERVHALFRTLKSLNPPGILDLIPTYRSLLIQYDPWECSFEQLLLLIEDCLENSPEMVWKEAGTVEIPVCYGGRLGPDLDEVAGFHGLTPAQVVDLHCAPLYYVYMIGFSPGFPYLGGLDARLFTPRRKEPREKAPAGSVGIADRQTGIYSIESPGGWRLIGRTPLKLFDLGRTNPFTLSPGSTIRFKPISGEAFERYQAP